MLVPDTMKIIYSLQTSFLELRKHRNLNETDFFVVVVVAIAVVTFSQTLIPVIYLLSGYAHDEWCMGETVDINNMLIMWEGYDNKEEEKEKQEDQETGNKQMCSFQCLS